MLKKLLNVQGELKAPKNQRNTFGNYNYRSCEDILEAAKPLCTKEGLLLNLTDEAVSIEGWHYIKATASVTDGEKEFTSTAYAREAPTKKGMDESQITGTASSYARKYALNGLFLIDDTKDADTQPPPSKPTGKQQQKQPDALQAAKARMWKALQAYAQKVGLDANQMLEEVKQRNDWKETVEFFTRVAEEFEAES